MFIWSWIVKSPLSKRVRVCSRVLLASASLSSVGVATAAMNADSQLSFTGTFGMEVSPGLTIPASIASLIGIKLGIAQPASGSHSGAPDGSESPAIDNPWLFFANTGMHQTTSAVTILSDDGAGNVTLDFSGWDVTWNGIASIPMGSGAWEGNPDGVAIVTCANTCEYGDTYTLDYSATVPPGDPSGFGGVPYNLNISGTLSQQPSTNTAPVAIDDAANVDRKASGRIYVSPVIDVVQNDTDVDGNGDIDRSSVTIQTDAINGTTSVDPTTGNVTYTPYDDYLGMDSFTYTVFDLGGPEGPTGVLESNVATVSIAVINAVPVAVDDAAITDTATAVSIDVTSNDTDADGAIDPTTVTIVTDAVNGTTSVDPVTGIIVYTPNPAVIGQDTYTYTVNDNDGAISNPATVTVTVGVTTDGVLDPNATLFMVTGNVIDPLTEPPPGQGSWFSMEVQPGHPLHTAIAGFNHLQLGVIQPASSVPLVPNIDQGWIFFGNIGVHQTTLPVTILSDDGAGNVYLDMTGWDVSWNAIPSIPLDSGGDPEGVGILTCYTDLALLAQGDCSTGDQFVLEYTAVVPPGDPSGFGGVPYRLHMEGYVSFDPTDVDHDGIPFNDDNCPVTFNPDQTDSDGDGLGDVCDNCTLVANPPQRDTDLDGYGNYCDPDFNNDLIVNAYDLALFKTQFFTTFPDADLNGSGTVNGADLAILKSFFFKPPGPSAFAP